MTALHKHHGWNLVHNVSDDHWSQCRTVGYLLDRVDECVEVFTHDSQAVILISQDDTW